MFHSHSIFNSTSLTPLLPSPLKLQNFTTPNECVLCVCVKIWYLFHIHDSKLISVCLINDYSLIADLHIFVYKRTECASISLECTKVKLLILNNFGYLSTLGLMIHYYICDWSVFVKRRDKQKEIEVLKLID